MMVEWIFGFIVQWIIGERLFIGLALAATIAGSAFLAFTGNRMLANLTAVFGLCVTGFLVGLNVANHACDQKIQGIEDRLQEEVDKERARQDDANRKLQELQIENTRLSERASAARVQTVREIRREVRTDPTNCTWSRGEFERLRELTKGRRKSERRED